MARKKITIQREKVKPLKKKRKLSEEHKEKLRARLAEMRAKRKPAEYKNIHPTVLALPEEDEYSMKNVKEWIKESREKVSAYNKSARSSKNSPSDRQIASNLADNKRAYIRMCEHYLKTGDWIAMYSGKNEEHKVITKCIAMAYYPDGTPKRTVGVFYPDINMVWTKDMDESEFVTQENREYIKNETVAMTDKQFIGDM